MTSIAALSFVLASPTRPAAADGTGAEAYLPARDGGPRRLQVVRDAVLVSAPSKSSNQIAELGEGALLSNLGCHAQDPTVWCEVTPFRGGARGFIEAAHLVPASGPDGSIPMGLDDSEKRAIRRQFDARGDVACAQERGEAMGLCQIGVARGTGGDATLVATFANGFSRRLTFRQGEFVFADTTMSGTGRDIAWSLETGVHVLRVDDQRFDIPDRLVFGE